MSEHNSDLQQEEEELELSGEAPKKRTGKKKDEQDETGHTDDAIKLYLKEIQKTTLLTAENERELAAKIAEGDEKARNKMIESNLRLVVKISKRYMNRGLPFLDLIEEGNMGLIKAVERFKVSKGCRFSTYATWWIRQSIERGLVNQSRTIRLPVHVSDDINKILKTGRILLRELNREPTAEEIAEAMDTKADHVNRLLVLIKKTYSIEHPIGDSNDFNLMDTIEDSKATDPRSLIEDLNRYDCVNEWLETLSENERRILELRFGLNDCEPQTLDTIGKLFGVTRERIRQIESKSLQKLRKICNEKHDQGD